MTPHYADLLFAFGYARLGDEATARALLTSAGAALTASGNWLPAALYRAFRQRIEAALAGQPHHGPVDRSDLRTFLAQASPREAIRAHQYMRLAGYLPAVAANDLHLTAGVYGTPNQAPQTVWSQLRSVYHAQPEPGSDEWLTVVRSAWTERTASWCEAVETLLLVGLWLPPDLLAEVFDAGFAAQPNTDFPAWWCQVVPAAVVVAQWFAPARLLQVAEWCLRLPDLESAYDYPTRQVLSLAKLGLALLAQNEIGLSTRLAQRAEAVIARQHLGWGLHSADWVHWQWQRGERAAAEAQLTECERHWFDPKEPYTQTRALAAFIVPTAEYHPRVLRLIRAMPPSHDNSTTGQHFNLRSLRILNSALQGAIGDRWASFSELPLLNATERASRLANLRELQTVWTDTGWRTPPEVPPPKR